MILDGHVHVHDERGGRSDVRDDFNRKMRHSGVSGAVILSSPPSRKAGTAQERLRRLFYWAGGNRSVFPFYWIDPMAKDAMKQVDAAVKAGVKGFKVICAGYFPYDKRPMSVWRHIAARKKPILFHSGILWDGTPSSVYNRPAGWECMLDVPGIRFALAHISWPWVDECIAVFGKFEAAAGRGGNDCEMFIDTTPGTPPIYREEALTKVFKIGYNVAERVFFGTDLITNRYGFNRAKDLIAHDRKITAKLGLSKKMRDNYFSENLRRFVG